MKKRPKQPRVPRPIDETIRRQIFSILSEGRRSAKELSSEVRVSEKEAYDHLEHIRISMGRRFVVSPAECKKCGFVFSKRERLKKPGKCPVCRSEALHEPLFAIENSS